VSERGCEYVRKRVSESGWVSESVIEWVWEMSEWELVSVRVQEWLRECMSKSLWVRVCAWMGVSENKYNIWTNMWMCECFKVYMYCIMTVQ